MQPIRWARCALLVVDVQQGFTTLRPAELPVPGGLEIVPHVNRLLALPWAERCAEIVIRLLGDEFERSDLAAVAREAFDFPVPVLRLEDRIAVLELFHGPTLAFKDFGARFLARMLRLEKERSRGRDSRSF